MPKNPPHLIEVEFTIWWHLYTKKERDNAQLIHGDLFTQLKEKYPIRNVSNQNVFVFKESDDSVKEIELSKESLTFSNSNNMYDWLGFESDINYILNHLFPILELYLNLDHIHLELSYVDCFEENYDSIVKFYSDNLNLTIDSKFIKKEPRNINATFEYELEIGSLEVEVGEGIYLEHEGILLVSKVISKKEKFELEHTNKWLSKAHEISSQLYKNVIEQKS